MANYETRSGVCRAGVSLAGVHRRTPACTVAGVARGVQWNSLIIEQALDGSAATASFRCKGWVPAPWQEVKIGFGTLEYPIFAGYILPMSFEAQGWESSTQVEYAVTAVDYRWRMNTKGPVFASYDNVGINTIIADLLRRATDGGFSVGWVPSSLGNVSIAFQGETVTGCLDALASTISGYWRVTGNKRIDMGTTFPIGNTYTLGDSTAVESLRVAYDGSQWRTRVTVLGAGSQAIELSSAGANYVRVADTSPFADAGGTGLVEGAGTFTYTGRSTASGTGYLTGCAGFPRDVFEGDPIRVVVTVNDATAQTAAATALGGDGVITHQMDRPDLNAAGAAAVAAADLAAFKSSLISLSYSTRAMEHLAPGALVTVSLTTPATISSSFRVQRVRVTLQEPVVTSPSQIVTTVDLAAYQRSFTDFLRQVAA